MPRHELRLSACLATATLLGLAVSFTAAGDDPIDVAKKPDSKAESKTKVDPSAEKQKEEPEFVRKTDAQWRRILTPVQYMVTRLKETEPAFTGKYASGHFRGTFVCVCCGAELFSSRHKFESGTGWPSFWQPINAKALQPAPDYSAGEVRTEVMCRRCGAHLGHVFEDAPATPTGLRFCINSVSLRLQPPTGESSPKKVSSRTKLKTKTHAKTRTKSAGVTHPKSKQPTTDSTDRDENNQPAGTASDPPKDKANPRAQKANDG